MSGTLEGGRKAARTNVRLYGQDFYARIGAIGGRLGRTGGFWADRELARRAGKKGGHISKRRPRLDSFTEETKTSWWNWRLK